MVGKNHCFLPNKEYAARLRRALIEYHWDTLKENLDDVVCIIGSQQSGQAQAA